MITKKCKLSASKRRRIIETILTALLTCAAIAFGATGCKAWRTISTTASYTQKCDSDGNTSAVIQTKTVEEYQGRKK